MRLVLLTAILLGLAWASSAPLRARAGEGASRWPLRYAAELNESVSDLARRAKETPDDPDAPEFLWRRAHALANVDRIDEAIAVCGLLVDAYPDADQAPEALAAQAAWHQRLNQSVECEATCRAALDRFPDSPHADVALYLLAWSLTVGGKYEEAAEIHRRLAVESPSSRHAVDAACRAAEWSRRQGRLDEAQELLEAAIDRRDPEFDPIARLSLATVAAQREDWAIVLDAVEPLITATTTPEHRLAALFWRAESAFRLGDWPGARDRFDALEDAAAAHAKPGDVALDQAKNTWLPAAFVRRGQIAAHEKKWNLAREWASRGINEFPEFERRHEFDYLLARATVAYGKLDDARTRFEQVAKVAGDTETGWASRWMVGESLLMQRRHDEALDAYAALHDDASAPGNWRAAAWLQAGKCREATGDWKAATQLYALAKAIDDGRFGDEAATRLAEVDRRRKKDVPQPVGRASR